MKVLLKFVFVLMIFVLTNSAAAQSELSCKVIAIHREASGQSLRGSKAVLDVITNRMRVNHQTACQVIKAPGQFPWSLTQKSWKFTNQQLTRYFESFKLLPQVPSKVIYFNNQQFVSLRKKFCCKIEDHYFYFK